MENFKIPQVNFKIREGDVVLEDGCSFDEGKWIEKTTDDFFKGKRVVLFSLPGAFTPTCTSTQLPGFDDNYDKIKSLGVDEIYCCSVNDTFVMNAWAEILKVKNVKVLPDGSGNFTRYMAVINDGVVEKWWQEPGINNEGTDDDPYVETTPENMIAYLQG